MFSINSLQVHDEPELPVNNTLGAVRVLFAEDNAINQLIGTTMLQRWGFVVKKAANGFEAIDMLEMEDFDVVLMDIQMPDKDGMEATEEIRLLTNEAKRNVPIIALTAHVLDGDEARFLQAGMNGYVTKPFKENVLYDAIAKAIRR